MYILQAVLVIREGLKYHFYLLKNKHLKRPKIITNIRIGFFKKRKFSIAHTHTIAVEKCI